jgi:predicted peroxiredoxin
MSSLLITTLVGPDDPTRASIGFHVAVNGAVKNQIDTRIALAGDAIDLLKPGVAEKVRGVGVPPLAELLSGCVASGVKIYV